MRREPWDFRARRSSSTRGRRFEFGITVQNTGRFTVQVLGVPYSQLVLPFSARLLMSGPQKGPGMEEP